MPENPHQWEIWEGDTQIDIAGEDLDGRGGYAVTIAHEAKHNSEFYEVYAAPTTSEIGVASPDEVATQRKTVALPDGTEIENQWCAYYAAGDNTTFEYAPTEVEARGKMLFYLLKNGYIKPEELNK